MQMEITNNDYRDVLTDLRTGFDGPPALWEALMLAIAPDDVIEHSQANYEEADDSSSWTIDALTTGGLLLRLSGSVPGEGWHGPWTEELDQRATIAVEAVRAKSLISYRVTSRERCRRLVGGWRLPDTPSSSNVRPNLWSTAPALGTPNTGRSWRRSRTH